ncbi:stage III sporulation protein AF [Geobacillus sp. C56-T2]|uniref:stage III sporulation protein AF n=1 Tax=Geobacillus sp. C56-T2 TaxID=600773 RepID=UPI000539B4FD|nr:stage III sporulation protein AF [Geobacillus sp. C56-T2]NNV05345.1 stage III sporulation protein AF [Geobacillus sp. MMMUD3]TWG31160.1 stage III sporulation protein AF [Geobacillus sp. C56-T2]
MPFVIEWVTNIILFLLFAVVIDFLLPSGTMQKYVKMAIGLLLLLVMLTPVLRLASVAPEQLVASALARFSGEQTGEDAIKNEIERQKKEIQASQRAYILEQMAVQLENDVNEELMKKYGLKADVNVSAEPTSETWRMPDDIRTISVVLSKQRPAGTVEPVTIDTTKPPDWPAGDAALAEEVRSFLAGRWEVDEHKIDVQFRGRE